jgi:hypothetical protein
MRCVVLKRGVIATLLAVAAVLMRQEPLSAQCAPPHFQIVSDSFGELAVMVPQAEFTIANLICVTDILQQRHLSGDLLAINFFDAVDDARKYDLGLFLNFSHAEGADARRATYIRDRTSPGEEYTLAITPRGLSQYQEAFDDDTEMKIDRGIPTPGHCRLEMDGRCLLHLAALAYPILARTLGVMGAVSVAGTIQADGTVRDVHATTSAVAPQMSAHILVQEAVNNLLSWRFEPSARESSIQITYDYSLVDQLPKGGEPHVSFELPTRITILDVPTQHVY